MKPPIIVFEGEDLSVFRSVHAAATKIEHYDVESGAINSAYDSEGRRLEFRVLPAPPSIPGVRTTESMRVTLSPSEPEQVDPETLGSLLANALDTEASRPLAELVAEAFERFEVE